MPEAILSILYKETHAGDDMLALEMDESRREIPMFRAEQFRAKAEESTESSKKYRRSERNPQISAINGKLQPFSAKRRLAGG
jgi:hypothetical protein